MVNRDNRGITPRCEFPEICPLKTAGGPFLVRQNPNPYYGNDFLTLPRPVYRYYSDREPRTGDSLQLRLNKAERELELEGGICLVRTLIVSLGGCSLLNAWANSWRRRCMPVQPVENAALCTGLLPQSQPYNMKFLDSRDLYDADGELEVDGIYRYLVRSLIFMRGAAWASAANMSVQPATHSGPCEPRPRSPRCQHAIHACSHAAMPTIAAWCHAH